RSRRPCESFRGVLAGAHVASRGRRTRPRPRDRSSDRREAWRHGARGERGTRARRNVRRHTSRGRSCATLWDTRLGFGLPPVALSKPLLLWIDDRLMAVFSSSSGSRSSARSSAESWPPLAFTEPAALAAAKVSIVMASAIAGAGGYVLLKVTAPASGGPYARRR